jgi:hypothetical protein
MVVVLIVSASRMMTKMLIPAGAAQQVSQLLHVR